MVSENQITTKDMMDWLAQERQRANACSGACDASGDSTKADQWRRNALIAQAIIENFGTGEPVLRIPPASLIVEWVAVVSGVSLSDLLGTPQQAPVRYARTAAYVLLREVCNLSYQQIADTMNRSSHNPVWGAINRNRPDEVNPIIRGVKAKWREWGTA